MNLNLKNYADSHLFSTRIRVHKKTDCAKEGNGYPQLYCCLEDVQVIIRNEA